MRPIFHHSTLNDAALRDVVHLLHSNAFNGMIISVAAISALAFGFDTPETHSVKRLFWLIMVSVLLLRFLDAIFWMKVLRQKDTSPRPAFFRFAIGVTLTAIIWGLYCVTLYPLMDIMELATTVVVLSALAGGAAAVLGASRPLVWTYCTLLLIPVSVMALTDPRKELFMLGLLGFGFCIIMLGTSRKTNAFYLETISLREKNQALVEQMAEERNEVVRVNEALRLSNQKLDNMNATLEAEVHSRTEDIVRLSNRDPLTGLMNRAAFLNTLRDKLKQAAFREEKLAILFTDLDGFKQVNDSLGHQTGDQVLVSVASRFRQFAPDDCLSRWGGDEFIIVATFSNLSKIVQLAKNIRASIAQGMAIDRNIINLDATTGIAIFPDHGDNEQLLIQRADITMYHEKRRGVNHTGIFSDNVHDAVCREMQLRDGLRSAIINDQLHLVYQPIVDAGTGLVWSYEALLRWQFNGQPVSPADFIPVAERSGLINDIGLWVLSKACETAASWKDPDVAVSVNVSVIQLMEDNFILKLDEVLSHTGLAPSRLHLEITESVFADNKQKLAAQVNAIKNRRVAVSIDDFGTGFSSLSQLQLLHFDHIKIDRSFIHNLDSAGGPIIRATLLIAGEFGCKTVAEGVETEEQATRLKAMGVDYLQGFYFARPERAEALTGRLETEQ